MQAEEELLDAQLMVGHYDNFKEKMERMGAAVKHIKGKEIHGPHASRSTTC